MIGLSCFNTHIFNRMELGERVMIAAFHLIFRLKFQASAKSKMKKERFLLVNLICTTHTEREGE